MWKYRIVKNFIGYNIYKKREKDGMISVWFLGPNDKWVLNKDHARTFYTLDDAIGNLSVIKFKDGKAD